jgi:hypothetical protein
VHLLNTPVLKLGMSLHISKLVHVFDLKIYVQNYERFLAVILCMITAAGTALSVGSAVFENVIYQFIRRQRYLFPK